LAGEDPGMASSSKGRASSRKRSSAGKARVISTKRKDALPRTGSVSAGRPKPVVLPPTDALTEPLATATAAPKKKAHGLHRKETTASRKKTTRAAGRASAKPDKPAAVEVAQAVAAVSETLEVATPAPVGEGFPSGVVEAPALSSPATEPPMVTALEPVADTVGAEEPPATAYEVFAVTALEVPQVEALAVVETELEVEASAIVEELPVEAVPALSIAIKPPPIPEETRGTPPARTTAAHPTPAPPAPHHERRSLMPALSRLLSTLCRWTGVSGTK